MRNLFSLEQKVAIITGAAQGLGKAVADLFIQMGCRTVIADTDRRKLFQTAEALGEMAYPVVCDVTNQEQINRMCEETLAKFKTIDILVSNAAVFQSAAAEDMDFETEWRRVMNVNLDGSFRVCQTVGKAMIRQGYGNMIIMSSKSGIAVDVPQKQIAYNTSKAALIMMAKTLAVEWAPYHIRVNCIAPGNIITENQRANYEGNNPITKQWMSMNTMHRPGTPEEVAAAAVYLASDASGYVTGNVENVDGGYLIM